MQMPTNKLAICAATAIAATSIAAYTFAAPNYERIKRDIDVMIGIVKSSIENSDDCEKCNVKISGHYLAEQGVVFNVNPSSQYQFKYDYDYSYGPDIARGIVAIPEMVEGILENVQVHLDGSDFEHWEIHTESGDVSDAAEIARDAMREAREGMREARHEMRELSREMRELEIEAIHAEEEELKEIERREKELEQELSRAESQQEKIVVKMKAYANEKTREAEQKRAERQAEKQRAFTKMETIVLNTFCDYSSTMRNVPDDEKVSIIVKQGDEKSKIYVFEQAKLSRCDSEETAVRDQALSYIF